MVGQSRKGGCCRVPAVAGMTDSGLAGGRGDGADWDGAGRGWARGFRQGVGRGRGGGSGGVRRCRLGRGAALAGEEWRGEAAGGASGSWVAERSC